MKRLTLILFLALQGCASSDEESDYAISPTVHPAAYTTDGFYLDVPKPARKPTHVNDFWIGQCGRGESGSYYSKTSYTCPR